MKVNGLLHVHSRFSYDGRHSIDELAQHAAARGWGFLAITDHSDTLDGKQVAAISEECRRVSSREFLAIPGIEFRCRENLHLLGIGVRRLVATSDPVDVAKFIRAEGGLAVVAHPIRYRYAMPRGLAQVIDGIEVWNVAYNGRFVPDPNAIDLLERLGAQNARLLAFGGQDLHRMRSHRAVHLRVSVPGLTEQDVLEGLRQGAFSVSNGLLALPSRSPGWSRKRLVALGAQCYRLGKRARAALL